jgi:hypothetical protein
LKPAQAGLVFLYSVWFTIKLEEILNNLSSLAEGWIFQKMLRKKQNFLNKKYMSCAVIHVFGTMRIGCLQRPVPHYSTAYASHAWLGVKTPVLFPGFRTKNCTNAPPWVQT